MVEQAMQHVSCEVRGHTTPCRVTVAAEMQINSVNREGRSCCKMCRESLRYVLKNLQLAPLVQIKEKILIHSKKKTFHVEFRLKILFFLNEMKIR